MLELNVYTGRQILEVHLVKKIVLQRKPHVEGNNVTTTLASMYLVANKVGMENEQHEL
jgi:hypothetical protein